MTTTHGSSTSTMGMPTTTIRTIQTMCVLFGLLQLKKLPLVKIKSGVFNFDYMQLSLFDINPFTDEHRVVDIEELFEAYYCCRKTKRNTQNALKFEVDYEENLCQIKEEIESGSYAPGRSIAFIVHKPVKREIFAADFRDRVVHHWLINKLNPLFENLFIEDSYACRVGKGTHYGIKKADSFIKSCSENYIQDCYVLKLDIQGFFMHINPHQPPITIHSA